MLMGLMEGRAVTVASTGGGGSPTTLNPSDKAATVTLSASNLVMTTTAAGAARSIASYTTGKYYFEAAPSVTINSFDHFIGIATGSAGLTTDPATDTGIAGLFNGYDHAYVATVDTSANGITYNAFSGDTLGVAVDFGAELIWFRVASVSSTWSNGGDPAAGTNGISFASMTGPYFAYGYSGASSGVNSFNFGSSTFVATAPSGFGNM